MKSVKKNLIFASGHPPSGNWDPYSHALVAQIIIEGFTHNLLFRAPVDGEKTEDLIPDLALRQELIDLFTLEYRLRKNVKFHDGKSFGAEDLKATIEWAIREDNNRPMYPGLADVEIVDQWTARIHTKNYGYPASAWSLVVTMLPIISADDVRDPKKLSECPNGTGPFIFSEHSGYTTRFKANPDYFSGKPKLEEVVYRVLPHATSREVALRTGEVDLIERLEPHQIHNFKGNPECKLAKTVSVENKYLHFRCKKTPFDDWRVRRAACHAIGRDIILEIMGAGGHFTGCHVSPKIWGSIDNAKLPEYDPAMCQKLLKEAGYPNGKGLPELEYIVSDGWYPKTKEYCQVIASMLEHQNFPVKLNVMSVYHWMDMLWTRPGGAPGHMIDSGWSVGTPEPDATLRSLYRGGKSLIPELDDPEINAALDRERNEGDIDKRRKLLETQTLPLLAKKVPSLPLFASVNIHCMKANLMDVDIAPDGRIWLDKAFFA